VNRSGRLLRGVALLSLGPAMLAIWHTGRLPDSLAPFSAPQSAAVRVVLADAFNPNRDELVSAGRRKAPKPAGRAVAARPRVSRQASTPSVRGVPPAQPTLTTSIAAASATATTTRSPQAKDTRSVSAGDSDQARHTSRQISAPTSTTPAQPTLPPPTLPTIELPATPPIQLPPPAAVTLPPPVPTQAQPSSVQLPAVQVPSVQAPAIKLQLP
jgi:hypothetical protein